VKFVGMGEKYDALEAFYPDRIVSRVLGMGDILSLIERTEQTIDHKKAAELEQLNAQRQRASMVKMLMEMKQKDGASTQAEMSSLINVAANRQTNSVVVTAPADAMELISLLVSVPILP
jgi:signal recognition particle GTPase